MSAHAALILALTVAGVAAGLFALDRQPDMKHVIEVKEQRQFERLNVSADDDGGGAAGRAEDRH